MAGNNNQNSTGKKVEDIVQGAIQSGDFSRLAEIGPLVQTSVKDAISGVNAAFQNGQAGYNKSPQNEQNDRNNPPQSWKGWGGKPQQNAHPGMQQNYNQWQAPKGNKRHRGYAAGPGFSMQQSQPNKMAMRMPSSNAGTLSVVMGSLGATLFGGLGLFSLLLLNVSVVGGIVAASVFFGAAALSGSLIAKGVGKGKQAALLRRCYAILQNKNVCTFEELASQTGKPAKEIQKQARKLLFQNKLPGIRMDEQETCLIYGEEAYQQYLQTEAARKERLLEEQEKQRRLANPETADLEYFTEEGKVTLQKIRAANDQIEDPEVSKKLYRLEVTVGKIFTYVEKKPRKLPETRRFMNYYLPTCLKLVEAYREYDAMEVQVANVLQAKKEIEQALETMDDAFNNLLHELYEEEVMDVTTDIEVLGAMLEQEGLTGNRFISGSEPQKQEDEGQGPTLRL